MQLRPAHEVSWPAAHRPRSRGLVRLALAILLPLLLLAGGYTIWWLTAAAEFRAGTIAWIEQRRAEGVPVAYADVSRHGFPFRLGVRIDRPRLGDPAGTGWALTAARAKLTTPLTGERTLRLAISGDLEVFAPAAPGRQRWSGRARQFSLDLAHPEGWMPNGRLAVRDLILRSEGADDDLAIGRADVLSAGDPAAATAPDVSTWSVDLAAYDLRLPKSLTQACGRDVSRLAVAARVFGGLEPRPWPATLARWRDGGGVIEAQRAAVVCGPLIIDGEGTFALDDRGQPMGAMSTRIQGYEPALDRLAAANAIDGHTAAAAKILLRALARSNAEGASTLSAPLTLQDRSISLGPVTLLRVPQVDWLGTGGGR